MSDLNTVFAAILPIAILLGILVFYFKKWQSKKGA